MKVSLYTFLISYSGEYYAYNSLSNALLEIDDEIYMLLKKSQNGNVLLDGGELNDEIIGELRNNFIITDNDIDDFLLYKAHILHLREVKDCMHVTISPTTDCCFNCHYCFEKVKSRKYITSDVIDSIVGHIKSHEGLKYMMVTWFGGEPLMAVDKIGEFYSKFKQECGHISSYYSNIITTGYHLDNHAISVLKSADVSSMQITLDGMMDTHNRVKSFFGAGNVFEQTLENIDLLCCNSDNIRITIRVNLTFKNRHEYLPLMKLLQNRFSKYLDRINIVPAFVLDRGNVNCDTSSLFSRKQLTDYVFELSANKMYTHYTAYPNKNILECAIRNKISISFDPEGYAYKCWESIGDKKYAIGKLDADGMLTDVNVRMLNRQLYGADPLDDPICQKCKYLPICGGGCPIQRIENKFEGGNNNCCTYHKGHIEDIIREHIERKKMMLGNKASYARR